jgi:hypothetical protein
MVHPKLIQISGNTLAPTSYAALTSKPRKVKVRDERLPRYQAQRWGIRALYEQDALGLEGFQVSATVKHQQE